jgi:hypothetical protein
VAPGGRSPSPTFEPETAFRQGPAFSQAKTVDWGKVSDQRGDQGSIGIMITIFGDFRQFSAKKKWFS